MREIAAGCPIISLRNKGLHYPVRSRHAREYEINSSEDVVDEPSHIKSKRNIAEPFQGVIVCINDNDNPVASKVDNTIDKNTAEHKPDDQSRSESQSTLVHIDIPITDATDICLQKHTHSAKSLRYDHQMLKRRHEFFSLRCREYILKVDGLVKLMKASGTKFTHALRDELDFLTVTISMYCEEVAAIEGEMHDIEIAIAGPQREIQEK
ncbi:hypothetical protein EDC01DRAFT_630657 [Geopyxis carbonaria]|nr:hypothetical protein EDC01DRAFT_630657 [Geopyxis carbonaria]